MHALGSIRFEGFTAVAAAAVGHAVFYSTSYH